MRILFLQKIISWMRNHDTLFIVGRNFRLFMERHSIENHVTKQERMQMLHKVDNLFWLRDSILKKTMSSSASSKIASSFLTMPNFLLPNV